MAPDKKIELIIQAATALLTLATVMVGIWQFNKGQIDIKTREIEQRNFELEKMTNQATIETLSKFKEIQNKYYIEATSIVSYLTVSENFESQEHKNKVERFWQLYWVELSAVETPEVESAMVTFGRHLQELQEKQFSNFKEKQQDLKISSYELAQAIKKSASTWTLPEGLKK